MTIDTLDTSFLSDDCESVTGDADLARLIIKAQEHHQHAVDQLHAIASQSDKSIRIGAGDDDDMVLEIGSTECAAFQAGVAIALQVIGSFPIKISEPGEEN